MGKFDEPIDPIPPLSAFERRWFRNCFALVIVLLALALFALAVFAEAPAKTVPCQPELHVALRNPFHVLDNALDGVRAWPCVAPASGLGTSD